MSPVWRQFTCASEYGLGAHDHAVPTQCLYSSQVLAAGQKAGHRVAGEQGGVVEHPLVVDPEHGDRRSVPHHPAQGVVVRPRGGLPQVLDF
jgi:hypothetical protein